MTGPPLEKNMHIGIIADGNRRWAKEKGLPTIEGHKKGLETIEQLITEFAKTDVKFLTFYVFSNENWSREEAEVSYLMNLATTKILKLVEKMQKNNLRFIVLGSKDRLESKLSAKIDEAEEMTKDCTGLTVCFCFNYGGQQEIADAVKSLALNYHHELGMSPSKAEVDKYFSAANLEKHLYRPEIPACDLIVRTSGEQRISGFMLWRAAYSEFYFEKKYFPDMNAEDVKKILKEYQNRHRRFGK